VSGASEPQASGDEASGDVASWVDEPVAVDVVTGEASGDVAAWAEPVAIDDLALHRGDNGPAAGLGLLDEVAPWDRAPDREPDGDELVEDGDERAEDDVVAPDQAVVADDDVPAWDEPLSDDDHAVEDVAAWDEPLVDDDADEDATDAEVEDVEDDVLSADVLSGEEADERGDDESAANDELIEAVSAWDERPTIAVPPTRTTTASPAPAWAPTAHERDETDPGALRPKAPEPVIVARSMLPSRSRRAVTRLRALIGLIVVVTLAGVGLAAAIGTAVALIAFALSRAFGGGSGG
jgi:hypothetical protein